jgi:hypothetical protein
MAEQLWGPFEKFVDWVQCPTAILLCLPLHNSCALPAVHELFKRPSCICMYMCMYIYVYVCVRAAFFCACKGLAIDRYPVKSVVPEYLKDSTCHKAESEVAREVNACQLKKRIHSTHPCSKYNVTKLSQFIGFRTSNILLMWTKLTHQEHTDVDQRHTMHQLVTFCYNV